MSSSGNWWLTAACRDMDTSLFYMEAHGDQTQAARAKRICFGCPVRLDCLDEAIVTAELHGIWGGYAPKERRLMRRNYMAERAGRSA